MTDAAYWSRTLAWFLVYGCLVKLTYVSRSGAQRTWTGQLVGVGRGGPLIEWRGEKQELCAWSKLIAVEDVREEVAVPHRCGGSAMLPYRERMNRERSRLVAAIDTVTRSYRLNSSDIIVQRRPGRLYVRLSDLPHYTVLRHELEAVESKIRYEGG